MRYLRHHEGLPSLAVEDKCHVYYTNYMEFEVIMHLSNCKSKEY